MSLSIDPRMCDCKVAVRSVTAVYNVMQYIMCNLVQTGNNELLDMAAPKENPIRHRKLHISAFILTLIKNSYSIQYKNTYNPTHACTLFSGVVWPAFA